MKREYEDYLRDMLENAEKALSFVQGMDYDGFAKMIKLYMPSFGPLKLSEKRPAKSLKMFGDLILKSSGVKSLLCGTS
jgi:hypothetical protein